MWAQYRSKDRLLSDSQQGRRTSVLQLQGTDSVNDLNELVKGFISSISKREHSLISAFEAPSHEQSRAARYVDF